MNKFDNDYQDLLNINERLYNARKDVANLKNDLNSKCLDFLKKHSIIKLSQDSIGYLEYLLDTRISPKQFQKIFNKREIGFFKCSYSTIYPR